MKEHIDSGRKDTGITDKYSEGTPAEAYKKYKEDYPKPDPSYRSTAKDITDGKIKPRFIGPKSFAVRQQELIAHIENYQETFSNAEKKIWLAKYDELKRAANI